MLVCVCGIVIDPIIRRVRGPRGLPGSTSIVTRFPGYCLKYALFNSIVPPICTIVAIVLNMHGAHAPANIPSKDSKEYLGATSLLAETPRMFNIPLSVCNLQK